MKRLIKSGVIILCVAAAAASCTVKSEKVKNLPKVAAFTGKSADSAWVNYYVRKGITHLEKKDYNLNKVRAYIDTARLICEKKDFDYTASLHLLQSEYYYETGDYSKSETEATLAESKAAKELNYLLEAKALVFLGRYYLRTGFYQESIDHYDKSIRIADDKGLKGIKQRGYEGKATVFSTVGDKKAFALNLREMIIASIGEKDTLSALAGLLRLGTYYTEDGRDFRKADSTLKECMRIALLRKDGYYYSYAMANTGWNFYREKMLDSALYYYQRALKISLPDKLIGISTNALGNIGTIYRDLKEYDKAKKFYTKSLDQAVMASDYYSLSWVYKDMSDLYLSSRDTSKAFETYRLYKQYNDSVLSRKNTLGLAEARIRYDADAHNKEIALLQLRLKNNRILNAGYSILVVALLTIGFLIIRSNKINAKRRISEMNHKISEITQANLRQQMNPHFIFNTLNSIQYYMYQHDKLSTNNYLTKFSSLMRKVLDNSQHTSVPLRDELDALTLYLELECLRFKDKFEFRITVDDEIDPLMYKVPTMLIQPYVENSICHGLIPMEGKGFVNIDLKLAEDHIHCIIEDNGIGREAASERNLKREKNHNSLGTRITASRLELVNALYGTSMKTTYTDLKDENGEACGTRVELQIPILT